MELVSLRQRRLERLTALSGVFRRQPVSSSSSIEIEANLTILFNTDKGTGVSSRVQLAEFVVVLPPS